MTLLYMGKLKIKVFLFQKVLKDLLCKSMDWFLYDRDLRHERVNGLSVILDKLEFRRHLT